MTEISQFKMADGRHIENHFLAITRLHRVRLRQNFEFGGIIARTRNFGYENVQFRKSNMADGRHFENHYISISEPQIVRIARNLVRRQIFRRDASICIARISYGNVSGWVAGWLAVCHSRYCIKTTKPILKLFRPSGSPIKEAFGTPLRQYQIPRGTPSSGAFNTRGGKNWRFSTEMVDISETVRDRTMVTMER